MREESTFVQDGGDRRYRMLEKVIKIVLFLAYKAACEKKIAAIKIAGNEFERLSCGKIN